MKTTLICLIIAVAFRLAFEFVTAQEIVVQRAWLEVQDHSNRITHSQTISSDPSYTSITSDYKPLARKLPNGRWEIVFVSEIAEDLP